MTKDKFLQSVVSLHRHLKDAGISVNGVGETNVAGERALYVQLVLSEDKELVPTQWEDLTVVTRVVGRIRPANES